MGCDIHKLISNPFGDTQNWKLLDLQQVFSFPTEGFALGMTTCRTSGTTGKSNFRYQNTVFFYTTRCISNFLSNFRIRIFASCDIYHLLSQWVMKIPLFCQQTAKEWYFLLIKLLRRVQGSLSASATDRPNNQGILQQYPEFTDLRREVPYVRQIRILPKEQPRSETFFSLRGFLVG